MPDKIQNTNPYNRPPRIQKNFKPIDIDIPAPPTKPDEGARNLLMALLPMSSFFVMGLFYALIFSRGTGMGWLYALPMLAIAIFMFVISFVTFGQQKYEQRQRWIHLLRDYHRLLDKKESRLLAARKLQMIFLSFKFQKPQEILHRVKNLEITLWERRREDSDFLKLRLGIGDAKSENPIKPPDPDFNSPEIRRAFGIYIEYRKIPRVPVVIDLRQLGSVALVGSRNQTLPLLQALITQVTTLNSPDDIHLYMFSSEPYYKTWKWLRWLPHTSDNNIGGRPTFLAFTLKRSKELLASFTRWLEPASQSGDAIVAVDQQSQSALLLFDNEVGIRDELMFLELLKTGKDKGVYSIFLCEKLEDVPSDCSSVIEVDSSGFSFSATGSDGFKLHGKPDKVSLIETDNLSRRLLQIAIRTRGRNSRIPTRVNFLQLYGVEEIDELNIEKRWLNIPKKEDGIAGLQNWSGRPKEDGLLPFEVPIGNETFAVPLIINLSENNDGPHGLIAGTTGSGKSELLQTLISSLALEHHPYFLNFMLIDFKGASTFGVFEKMPHVVGLVSNLDKLSANRALEALNTENLRRQLFLRTLKLEDIIEYHQYLIASGKILDPESEPLPHLFVIVDEFAQMASEMPGFLDRLNEIARVGRSLGIHLVLATQRPAGVVKDEMRANLNFRISLRVQSIDDSRDMLRRPDAAYLPHDLPGRAYFQLGDGGTPRQFQVARVGTEYQPASLEDRKYDIFRINYEEDDLVKDGYQVEKKISKDAMTITKALVERIFNVYGAMPHKSMDKILLDPLPDEITADAIALGSSDTTDWRDWWETDWKRKWKSGKQNINLNERAVSAFQVPVGILDDLSNHSQPPLYIDFFEHGGHVMIVGGAQSGKTYFLQTLSYGIATHYSPAQVNIYVLSFAGKDLDILSGLPHVGSVIDGGDAERLNRLIRHLQIEVEDRKRKIADEDTRDLQDYNLKVDIARQLPYICVMIDNFGELRNLDYDSQLSEIEKLFKIGRMYGLHFVVTALQSNDIPSRLSNLIQHKIALNMGDHNEYQLLVGRPQSMDFDFLPKGRCFVNINNPPMYCQIGMPPEKEEWRKIIGEMKSTWEERNGKLPIPVSVLTKNLVLSKLLEDSASLPSGMMSLVGIDGDNFLPYWLDWKKGSSHYLVGGPSQSGRTSLLHTIVLSLSYSYSPKQLNIVLIDGSRSLGDLQKLPHVLDWITEDEGLSRNIANLQKELKYRREHSEKLLKFPEILFVIDDYDLTCDAFAINEIILSKLGKHVRQDSDLGFHFLISVLPENVTHADPLIKQIRLSRTGISLVNVDTLESLGGRPNSAMRNEELPEGRGYFFSRSRIKLLQFAKPDIADAGEAGNVNVYEMPVNKWRDFKQAVWIREAGVEEIELVRKDSESIGKQEGSGNSVGMPGSFINMDKAVELYIKQQKGAKRL